MLVKELWVALTKPLDHSSGNAASWFELTSRVVALAEVARELGKAPAQIHITAFSPDIVWMHLAWQHCKEDTSF